jgi:hypothetical protein
MRRWSSGEAVLVRETWHGAVFEARPATVVRDEAEITVLYVPARVRCGLPIGDDGHELRLPDRPWRLEVRERGPHPILSFAWPDTPYAILRWHTPDGRHAWYVNLQDPLRRTEIGFDTVDHALDAIVSLDGAWAWKDEDELGEAVADGLFTPEDAERFRADGERAVARILGRQPPFDRDWDGWCPEPSWPAPALPEGWDRP